MLELLTHAANKKAGRVLVSFIVFRYCTDSALLPTP